MAARDSYGRLLAFLAARSHDVAAAEDALGDAFRAALETWPHAGVPANAEAWLLTAARRRLIDAARHARVEANTMPTLLALAEEAQDMTTADGALSTSAFPDERLKLLFVCAHPAIDAAIRTPLMLQTVLGLDAARIAAAFVVQPTTMGQRLSRAKAKIRDAHIRFSLPSATELPARLDVVLEAIYAAYGSGWDDIAGADPRRRGLAAEALSLSRLVVALLPAEPEASGLLALMLHCEARREARRSSDGSYVPLGLQDVARWSAEQIDEAESVLLAAARFNQPGRFQLEAAIQSAHAQRRLTGRTDWESVALLYEGLVRLSPTLGALVSRAAAVAEARSPSVGLALLDALDVALVERYQPYWALRGHLLARLRQAEPAAVAYARAIDLSEDAATRAFLACQLTSSPGTTSRTPSSLPRHSRRSAPSSTQKTCGTVRSSAP